MDTLPIISLIRTDVTGDGLTTPWRAFFQVREDMIELNCLQTSWSVFRDRSPQWDPYSTSLTCRFGELLMTGDYKTIEENHAFFWDFVNYPDQGLMMVIL